MSLGAKELFHTNFLAFLLENHDPSVATIQDDLKDLLFGHRNVGRVITWREKESLDLVIMPAPRLTRSGDPDLDYSCTCANCRSNIIKRKTDYCDTIAVVIEAKLKSIPTDAQLVKYDTKLAKGIIFDLDDASAVHVAVPGGHRRWQAMALKSPPPNSPHGTDCTIVAKGKLISGGAQKNGRNGAIWTFTGKVRRLLLGPLTIRPNVGNWPSINWWRVANVLNCALACGVPPRVIPLGHCKATDLMSLILCDYRDSLRNLLQILSETYTYVTGSVALPLPTPTYGDYYYAITDAQFKARRIHDLVGKYASSILELHVMDFLFRTLDNPPGCGASCGKTFTGHSIAASGSVKVPCFGACNLTFELDSYTHFSNQQPGVGFQWCATERIGRGERKIAFGVQIQGNDYRHFICVEGGKDSKSRNDILDQLNVLLSASPNDWFVSKTIDPALRLDYSSGKNGKFFVFDESVFRYSKADARKLQMPDLAQAVCHSLCLARQLMSGSKGPLCLAIGKFF